MRLSPFSTPGHSGGGRWDHGPGQKPGQKLGQKLGRALRRLWRREDGTATIEFCFCVPIVVLITSASVESGLFMVRSALMDRGLDLVMRDYRLGRHTKLEYEEVRNEVCKYTLYVANCRTNLKIWIEPINTTTWTLPRDGTTYCGDRNQPLISPPVPGTVAETAGDEFVLVRVCALEDPIFPTTTFAARLRMDSATGKYALASSTVVVTEPREGEIVEQ